MSVATHHVGAENVLNGAAHWSYSTNGCPSCYFSVTNNEQIVGTPGVNYPFTADGVAICSIVGQFFGSSVNGGSLPGGVAPATESTVATKIDSDEPSVTDFTQSFGDTAGDSFDGSNVTESSATGGGVPKDTCYYSGSPYGPGNIVNGSTWTVAANEVAGQHNKWGYDHVGNVPGAVTWYRVNAPAHGHPLPCGFAVYQTMKIHCSSGALVPYTPPLGNLLTGTIELHDVINCRNDMSNNACQTINY